MPMDFDCLQKAGSRLGTGTMIVLDDRTCPVGMVHNLEQFFARESCGWCTPCRDGLPWARQVLGRWKTARAVGRPGHPRQHCWMDGAGPHLLRPGAGRGRAAAKRAEIFQRGFSSGTSARNAAPGDNRWPRSTSTISRYEVDGRAEPAPRLPLAGLRHCRISAGIPAMHSVGACRQCAVESVQGRERQAGQDRHGLHDARRRRHAHLDRRPRGGGRVPRRVIEWLMTNHPHDCPVCDEGGECHLQDMTVMTGHTYRRYPLPQAHAPQPVPRPVRSTTR